jgi:murein DD-endopeptidase MepM/ murein hydrolase activator NlpD
VNHYHQAVDLVARPGASVYAVGDGVIVPANPGLGKAVLKLALDPRGRWSDDAAIVSHIVYADLGDRLVRPGERVRAGQVVATVQPHGFVHFSTKRVVDGAEQFFDPALAGFFAAPSRAIA